jgi:hypothetical protein
MKLTIEIPTERTAEVLRFLAALMPVPASQEPQVDPAPGHAELPMPELPVAYESTRVGGRSNGFMKDFMIAGIQAGKTQSVQAWVESRIVAMDHPVEAEDPTRREFPWGDLPEPPPLLQGKTRWVNRGRFPEIKAGDGKRQENRIIFFLDRENKWFRIKEFSSNFPHIEAI